MNGCIKLCMKRLQGMYKLEAQAVQALTIMEQQLVKTHHLQVCILELLLLFLSYYFAEKLCTKRFKRLMIVLIFLLVIALLWLIVHNTYLWGIELKPLQYQLNVTMGDDSEDKDFTLLQELNSTISSATITLINPDITLTADMYLSPNRPPNYSTIFYKNIPILNGKNRYNYNVFGGDEPIYLTDGSSLMYNVSIEQVSSTVCPVRLYLFDNFTDYDRFRNPTADPSISYIDRSTCLYPKNGTWSFNISQSSTYYVGIDIDTGTSVTSNVTVNRVNYNTSGLQRSTRLTSSNPTDTITTCESGNRFLCTRNDDQYLIVSINGKNTISFQFKTFQVYGVGRAVSFSLMLSVSVVLIVIILIIVLVITVRMCHR